MRHRLARGELQSSGFRTGAAGAKVAFGLAINALILGTTAPVVAGTVVLIAQGQWLLLELMVLIEVVVLYVVSSGIPS